MNSPLRHALPLLLAAGLLAGCGRNAGDPTSPAGSSSGGAVEESAEVSRALAGAPELIEDGQYESAETTQMDGPAPGRLAAITPFAFHRNITSVERRFEFAFADTDSTGRPTTAIVTAHKLLRGAFIIATGPRVEGAPRDSARLVVRKPLADHWVRRLLLKRVPPPPDGRTVLAPARARWRVAASSGVEITSRPATTRILSLAIHSASEDTVIDDPLAFFRLRRIMKFNAGEEVTLVVTTERSDDVVVLVRAGLRSKFTNNGDNTYTLVWHAPVLAGLHHVGVNALSNGTLFDDEKPYDSNAWIVPCVVNPTKLAEFIP